MLETFSSFNYKTFATLALISFVPNEDEGSERMRGWREENEHTNMLSSSMDAE
jgi:hypothetical protein